MSSNNQKVSIILLRSAVFVVLAYWVGKVSIKLPRSGSFFNMEKVSIKLLRSAVLSTQKCVHRTANVRSSMDTFKTAIYGRISQVQSKTPRGIYHCIPFRNHHLTHQGTHRGVQSYQQSLDKFEQYRPTGADRTPENSSPPSQSKMGAWFWKVFWSEHSFY